VSTSSDLPSRRPADPTEGSEEALLAAAGALAAFVPPSIPVVGVLGALVAPLLSRRWKRWMRDLEARLTALEAQGVLPTFNEIVEQESFVSLIVRAHTAVAENHTELKLDLLRNVVLNAAVAPPEDFDTHAAFLRYVSDLGALHISVLHWIRENPEEVAEWKGANSYKLLRRRYLAWHRHIGASPEDFEMAVEELKARALLHISDRVTTYTRVVTFQKPIPEHPVPGQSYAFSGESMAAVSRVGELFLAFLEEPQDTGPWSGQ